MYTIYINYIDLHSHIILFRSHNRPIPVRRFFFSGSADGEQSLGRGNGSVGSGHVVGWIRWISWHGMGPGDQGRPPGEVTKCYRKAEIWWDFCGISSQDMMSTFFVLPVSTDTLFETGIRNKHSFQFVDQWATKKLWSVGGLYTSAMNLRGKDHDSRQSPNHHDCYKHSENLPPFVFIAYNSPCCVVLMFQSFSIPQFMATLESGTWCSSGCGVPYFYAKPF